MAGLQYKVVSCATADDYREHGGSNVCLISSNYHQPIDSRFQARQPRRGYAVHRHLRVTPQPWIRSTRYKLKRKVCQLTSLPSYQDVSGPSPWRALPHLSTKTRTTRHNGRQYTANQKSHDAASSSSSQSPRNTT
jgi:hypothetical protein